MGKDKGGVTGGKEEPFDGRGHQKEGATFKRKLNVFFKVGKGLSWVGRPGIERQFKGNICPQNRFQD